LMPVFSQDTILKRRSTATLGDSIWTT